jgi:putative restriction endonuclease
VASKRPLTIGEYPGQPVGTTYNSRRDAMDSHVHTQWGRGIDARIDEPGAGAICPSGGYVDDIDHGDWILYTGQGGRDAETGRQIEDQSLNDRDNAALVYSSQQDLPVRVLREMGQALTLLRLATGTTACTGSTTIGQSRVETVSSSAGS